MLSLRTPSDGPAPSNACRRCCDRCRLDGKCATWASTRCACALWAEMNKVFFFARNLGRSGRELAK
eukprot:1847696-Pleurochrysis_carterae.AAC.1